MWLLPASNPEEFEFVDVDITEPTRVDMGVKERGVNR